MEVTIVFFLNLKDEIYEKYTKYLELRGHIKNVLNVVPVQLFSLKGKLNLFDKDLKEVLG